MFDDSQLEKHGRVEHGIGILLIREYPAVLTLAHRRPAADGVLCGDTTVLMVADDAAQQTVIGGRNIVMGVQQDGGQCRGIDTEYLIIGNILGQFRIQGMDTLYHQYLITLHLQTLPTAYTLTSREVIAGQFHLLASEQGIHLFIKQRNVQGMEMLEIIVSLFVTRGLVTVQEVIVERDADRLDAVDGQLHAEAFAGRGLATAAGACYEHHLNTLPTCYLIGYLGNLLLLQGLANLNKTVGIAFGDGIIQVANRSHTKNRLPAMVLLEDLEHLILSDKSP